MNRAGWDEILQARRVACGEGGQRFHPCFAGEPHQAVADPSSVAPSLRSSRPSMIPMPCTDLDGDRCRHPTCAGRSRGPAGRPAPQGSCPCLHLGIEKTRKVLVLNWILACPHWCPDNSRCQGVKLLPGNAFWKLHPQRRLHIPNLFSAPRSPRDISSCSRNRNHAVSMELLGGQYSLVLRQRLNVRKICRAENAEQIRAARIIFSCEYLGQQCSCARTTSFDKLVG